jgi:RNA polymerase sigma factor (sigma-70 family)
VTELMGRELLVLPPVVDDPVFAEPLPLSDAPARALGGDPHDFAGLFMRHRWSFALHAKRFLSDQRDIDEVVQEAFLKLFLALPELETELQALAYARRTITNLCIDRYRADQRRPRLVDLESVPVSVLPEEDDVDPVVAAEDAAIVREALAMLSPLHREALIKREIEEKTLPQIAEELDIPVEQVKHVLHRARRALRRLLVGTHVEPGVDLDLAMVLAANRTRAANAAKPTGAAVIALLLVLAGVLGVRSGRSGGRVLDVAPAGAPLEGVVNGGTTAPAAPSAPQASPVQSATGTTGGPAKPSRRAVTLPPRLHSVRPAAPRVTPPAVVVAPPSPAAPIPTPPTVVAPPVVPAAFHVSGVGGSGQAQVADQQRALRAAGTTSSSTLSTLTETGTYALQQAYTFAADGSLADVSLSETVPLPDGSAVGTVVDSQSTSVQLNADGSVQLTTTGTAAPQGMVNGQTVRARALNVQVVLAADRVAVLSERVVVQAQPSPAPVAASATPVPAGLPAAPAAPSAPLPSIGPGPLLFLGAQDPARPSDAVVVDQDLGTH